MECSVMHSHLKGIKNVPRILGLLKAGRAKLSDWQSLVKVFCAPRNPSSLSNAFFLSSLSTRQCFGTACVNYIRQTV